MSEELNFYDEDKIPILFAKGFDIDGEITIETWGSPYVAGLNPTEAHELLQFLFNQLKAIGHPIELK